MDPNSQRFLSEILVKLDESFDVPYPDVSEDYYMGWNDAVEMIRQAIYEELLKRLFNSTDQKIKYH